MTAKQQPNSNLCFVCGLQNEHGLQLTFFDNGEDRVWCEYSVPKMFQGYPGLAHGGIAASILDEVCGRVSMISDPNHFMMTLKMELKYRQPVPIGVLLRAEGMLIKQKGRLAQARGELKLPDNSIAVEVEMLLADVPHDVMPADDQLLAELGWRVYD